MATCSECTYLNPEKLYESYDPKFWCDTKDEWHYAYEQECWRFCRAYSRSDSEARSLYERSRSPYYIATVICEILCKDKNCHEFQNIKKLRNDVMEKDKKYASLLMAYDIYWPIISETLKNDRNKCRISLNLYDLGIKKVSEFIDKKDYKKAIDLYSEMTILLIRGYNIIIRPCDLENSNITNSNAQENGKQFQKKYV